MIRDRPPGRAAVELHTHGSPRVVQRVVAALTRAGGVADAAAPAEDLDALLIRARTRRAVEFVLRQAHEIDRHVAALRRKSAAHGRDWLAGELDALLASAERVDRVLDGFAIAIVGPPGAGKSTLANRLIGEDRLLTSDQPGTTRDASCEPAAIDGIPVTLIDTAGDRTTEDLIEREAIRRGQTAASQAHIRLVVLDRSVPPADVRRLFAVAGPVLIVANKCDLPACWFPSDITSDIRAVEVAARPGTGLDLLRTVIRALVGVSDDDLQRPAPLTAGQRAAVRSARANLDVDSLADWPSVRPPRPWDAPAAG